MIELITPAELKEKMNQGEPLTIIDVREAEEVAQGMIPGAIHIPLGDLPDQLDDIPQTAPIILVCRSGNRSGRAYEFLEANGFHNLKNMSGGMLEW